MYISSLPDFSLDLQSRIRKPSKRQQGIDPLLPITPAKVPKAIPVPLPAVSFASRQIQGSQNRAAAAVLFTPHAKSTARQHRGQVTANQYPPASPTPLRTGSPLKSVLTVSYGTPPTLAGSDIEDDMREGLERLDLHSRSRSQSRSGSESPRAGPHSKHKVVKKPRSGAKDVWRFFENSSGRQKCLLCKCVNNFPHSHADI